MSKRRLKIIVVDDDEELLRVLPEDLVSRLKETGLDAEVTTFSSVDAALETLETESYHLAIVDLRFPNGRDGNDVLRGILGLRVLPVIVYTGYQEELAPEFEKHSLIHVAPSKKIEHIVEKISDWEMRKVFDFFSEEGMLATSLHRALLHTMWKHVSRYWDYLPTNDMKALGAATGRIAATLLYDVLSFGAGGKYEEIPVHHGEIYIFETPRAFLSVGDILELNGKHYVVLTPACDLVPRSDGKTKAEALLLAECEDLRSFADVSIDLKKALMALTDAGGGRRKRATENIEKMMRQAWLINDGRRFFLPPFDELPGYAVDFLRVRTASYASNADRKGMLEARVVSLNRDVANELATRFSKYMSRLGQPPFDSAALVEAVKRLVPE